MLHGTCCADLEHAAWLFLAGSTRSNPTKSRAVMFIQTRKMLCRSVLTAVVALVASGLSQATLVVGRFDPLFGKALQGVYYSGTASFTIAQQCLDLELGDALGIFIYSSNLCNGAASDMSFLGAQVNFTGSEMGQTTYASDPNAILGMFVRNHEVVGIQSVLIQQATGNLPGHEEFQLVFGQPNPVVDPNEGLVPVRNDLDNDYDDISVTNFQSTQLILVGGDVCSTSASCPVSSEAAVTEFSVPEPDSLALAFSALGLGWLVRRKRQGTVSRNTA
jgi:hypothetical protein